MANNLNFFAVFNKLEIGTSNGQNIITFSFSLPSNQSFNVNFNQGSGLTSDTIEVILLNDSSGSNQSSVSYPYTPGSNAQNIVVNVNASAFGDNFAEYGFVIDYVQSDDTPLFIHAIKDTTNGTTPNTVWVNAAVWLPPNPTITEPYLNFNNTIAINNCSFNLIELDLPDYSTTMQSNCILQGFPRFNNPMIILEAKDLEIKSGVALEVKSNNGNSPVASKSYGSCISKPKVTGITS